MYRMDLIEVFTSIVLFSGPIAYSCGAQIFAVVPMYGQSHWNVMDAVLQTLVSAGHNITAVTPFIKNEKITNYTEVSGVFFLFSLQRYRVQIGGYEYIRMLFYSYLLCT